MNKSISFLICGTLLILFSNHISAQFPAGFGWKMPRKSPPAKAIQTVGVTQIEVTYSRPSVRNRQIWGKGGLVPNHEVWRAGANEATTIRFSTEVMIDSTIIPAGEYALFIIPNETPEWQIIINRTASQWGAFNYNPEDDMARIQVSVVPVDHQESLLYIFSTILKNQTELNILWERKMIKIPIYVNLNSTVEQSAKKAFTWQSGYFAAQYYLKELAEYEAALKWVNASIALHKNLSNLWLKSSILAKMEKWEDAVEVGNVMLKIAEEGKHSKDQMVLEKINSSLQLWKDKIQK